MLDRAIGDPFLERFFSRIPRQVAASFTDDQLLAVKTAFAHQWGGSHSVDLRFSLPLPLRRWYVVLILGPERRSPQRRRHDRERHPLASLAHALFAGAFALFLTMAFLGLAYLVKSALGIDLFPDMSLGLWHEVREQFRLMFR